MKRRDFLRDSALAAGALGLNGTMMSSLARAAEDLDRYYVFVYFEGGWDHLLGLDPRDPAVYSPSSFGDTGITPGYEMLPAQFPQSPIDAGPFSLGPCIGELAGLTDHYSVVRGINMATLTHEVGRRYFITGRPPSGNKARGSSVSALASAEIGGVAPLPHLALSMETYVEPDLPSYAGALPIAAVSHLQFVLRESLGIPTVIRPGVRDALAKYWSKSKVCDDGGAGGSHLADLYRDNRARAADLVKEGLYTHFDMDSAELAPVRAHYGFVEGQGESPYGRAALAGQALKVGLSRVVSLTVVNGLDTHDGSWAGTHSVALNSGFDALARLITDLRDSEAPGGGSFLDKTTLVAFSEFGRTANLNAQSGRDHLLTNCALLAGAGIAPGQVIGSSSDNALGPNLIDLESGTASEGGISLKPEHVMTSALHAAGLDASRLQSLPIGPLLAD